MPPMPHTAHLKIRSFRPSTHRLDGLKADIYAISLERCGCPAVKFLKEGHKKLKDGW
jgi:hypothetical protein